MQRAIPLLLISWLIYTPAYAEIYLCHQLDTSISLQDKPCNEIELEEIVQLKVINAIDALPATAAGVYEDINGDNVSNEPAEAAITSTD